MNLRRVFVKLHLWIGIVAGVQVRDDWTHSPGLVYEHAGWALHTGVLFKLPVRVLWSIAGATPLLLFVTGLIVYRRKRGRWWTFGTAGRRRGVV